MNIHEYLQQHYTKQTTKAYLREIEIFISNNPNHLHYSYSSIINYVGILRKKYTNPKTINRILSSIKAYYSYLCTSNQRKDNPTKSIILKDPQSRDIQLQDLFTADELESLLTAKKERYKGLEYRNKVLISLLIYQALRPIEMEALQCDNINLEKGTIYIKATPKNNSRTLALKVNQILLFATYISEIRPQLLQHNQTNLLIIGHRKEPMTGEDITKHIKRNYTIFKPRNVTAMTIRQSVITNLLKQQNDLRIVQAFAGHKNPSTTEKYKQTNTEALQQQINLHHPIK
jgi:integrase/recombinase XerD